MSKCNACLQGLCRKHPLQDHGERASALKAKAKSIQQNTILDLIQSEIKKLESGEKGTSSSEIESYKINMIKERTKAEKQNENRGSSSSSGAVSYLGLNPAVASIMTRHDDDDNYEEDNSSNGKSSSKKTKKQKKEKKSKKGKKGKKEKKEKKRKRDRSTSPSRESKSRRSAKVSSPERSVETSSSSDSETDRNGNRDSDVEIDVTIEQSSKKTRHGEHNQST